MILSPFAKALGDTLRFYLWPKATRNLSEVWSRLPDFHPVKYGADARN